MLRLMSTPPDDEPEGTGDQVDKPADTPVTANVNAAISTQEQNGENHEEGKSTFRRLFENIESALRDDEPFTYYITNESGELKSVGIIVAIQLLAKRGEINPHQAIILTRKAEQTMRVASYAKGRKNRISPADIRAQQGALALLELEFDDKVEPGLSAKEEILRAIQQDQTETATSSLDDDTAKPILITIFLERANRNITREDALELVEKFCGKLKAKGGELGILDLASLYTEMVGGKKLLTPEDMEIVLKLAPVNESDIAILAPMFPEGMDVWKKACPNLPNILLADELSSLVERQAGQEATNTTLPRQPGFLTKRRFIFAAAALAVIGAAGSIARTSWESSSSGENQPAIKISALPIKEAISQSPTVQTIPKTTQATKERVAKTLRPKPATATPAEAPRPITAPIKIASSRPVPPPTPSAPVRPPSSVTAHTQPAQAPIQPIPAPTLNIPIYTKSGPAGPQFDEAGSTKQWEQAGWTVKIGLRPGGKRSYILTKDGRSVRIISPKVTAGQTTIEAEQVQ